MLERAQRSTLLTRCSSAGAYTQRLRLMKAVPPWVLEVQASGGCEGRWWVRCSTLLTPPLRPRCIHTASATGEGSIALGSYGKRLGAMQAWTGVTIDLTDASLPLWCVHTARATETLSAALGYQGKRIGTVRRASMGTMLYLADDTLRPCCAHTANATGFGSTALGIYGKHIGKSAKAMIGYDALPR